MLEVRAATINLHDKWNEFSGFIRSVRALDISDGESQRVIAGLLRLPKLDGNAPQWRREEEAAMRADIHGRLARYRQELGGNAYAVFNVVTDLAARPPDFSLFTKERTTLETRAGRWLRQLVKDSSAAKFTWDGHIAELTDVVSPKPQRPGAN